MQSKLLLPWRTRALLRILIGRASQLLLQVRRDLVNEVVHLLAYRRELHFVVCFSYLRFVPEYRDLELVLVEHVLYAREGELQRPRLID
jgi:hypothetical protein